MSAVDAQVVAASGHCIIVVNTTFRLAPAADILYAMDNVWWSHHADEVRRSFTGLRVSPYGSPGHGVLAAPADAGVKGAGNSGAGAINLAAWLGAAFIVLLGYDSKPDADGRRHWHDAHPRPMSDAASMARWPTHMQRAAARAAQLGIPVLNASRDTALTCFPRVSLEEVLA
jgi:sugar phosphate isomerase/epimerase